MDGKIDQSVFADAHSCLYQCTKQPAPDETFYTIYGKDQAFREQYQALVAQLPPEFSPINRRLKSDPKDLEVGGDLRAVIKTTDGRVINIYHGTGYADLEWLGSEERRRYPKSVFWIAYDVANGRMSGILNFGEKYEKYQFVGDKRPIVTALAYIAATEADVQRDLATGSDVSHADPQFPLQSNDVARAQARLTYLGKLFSEGKISGAESPVDRGIALRKPPQQWWVVNSEFTACHVSGGPAEKLDEFVGFTDRPTTEDFRDSRGELVKVEVSVDRGDGYDRVWTYFRSEQQCMAEQVNYSQQLADKYR